MMTGTTGNMSPATHSDSTGSSQRGLVHRRHRRAATLGLDRHHRPQHRQALGHRQRRVAPAPALGLALDARRSVVIGGRAPGRTPA